MQNLTAAPVQHPPLHSEQGVASSNGAACPRNTIEIKCFRNGYDRSHSIAQLAGAGAGRLVYSGTQPPLARVKLFTKWNSAIWTVWSVLARDHRDAVVDRAYRETECAARAVVVDYLGSMLNRVECDALIASIVTRRETSATVDAHRGVNLGYDCLCL